MDKEQLKAFLVEKREEGLSGYGEMQVQIADLMGLPDEAIRKLANVKLSIKVREWIYICILEGLPEEFTGRLPDMEPLEIEQQRKQHLRRLFSEEGEAQKKTLPLLNGKEPDAQKEIQKLQKELKASRTVEKRLQKEKQEQEERLAALEQETEEARKRIGELLAQRKEEGEKEAGGQTLPGMDSFAEAETENWFQRIRKKRQKKKETDKLLNLLREQNWSEEQRAFLIESAEYGMPLETIEKMAMPGMSVENMNRLRQLLLGGKRYE